VPSKGVVELRERRSPHPDPLPQSGRGSKRGLSCKRKNETESPHPDPLPQSGRGSKRGLSCKRKNETERPLPTPSPALRERVGVRVNQGAESVRDTDPLSTQG